MVYGKSRYKFGGYDNYEFHAKLNLDVQEGVMVDKYGLEAIDFQTSATALMMDTYIKSLGVIDGKVETILDLGCGYGGATKAVGNYFGAQKLYGVDGDAKAMLKAQSRGINTINANLETDSLPIPSGCCDVVMCNGVLEHLRYYDNAIIEAHKALKIGGFFVVTIPNLGSYVNRLPLFFGYQPSDVVISSQVRIGVLIMNRKHTINHIHAATIKAMTQLLEYYKFKIISVKKGDPRLHQPPFNKWWWFFRIVGSFCTVGWSRRVIVIAQKIGVDSE